MTNERIRPTWLYALIVSAPYFIGVLLSLSIIFYFGELNEYQTYITPISLIYYMYRVLLVRSNVFIVSDEQLIHERGVFSKKIDFLEMYRIKDYRIEKPFLMRLIGTMNVTLISSDKARPHLVISGVANSDIAYRLRELVELQRKNKRVYEVD